MEIQRLPKHEIDKIREDLSKMTITSKKEPKEIKPFDYVEYVIFFPFIILGYIWEKIAASFYVGRKYGEL